MEAKKLDLIDQIESGMAFKTKEFMENNKEMIDNPLFGPMSILNNMNTSVEQYKESLTRRREELELTLEEIEFITKEAYSRIYDRIFD